MSDLPPPPGTEPSSEGPFQSGYGPTGAASYGHPYGGTPPPVLSGFWRRFAASLIDGVLLAIPTNVLSLALGADTLGFNVGTGVSPLVEPLLTIVGIVVGVAYYSILEGGPKGQTMGKAALSIAVVDADTARPGIGAGRGAGRYFAEILSGLVFGLGYLWMLWDPRKQTWHDKLVRTVVVRTDVTAWPS